MTVTDEEKLRLVEEYANSLFPVFRASVLESPEREGYKWGYDQACYRIQQKLWDILDD